MAERHPSFRHLPFLASPGPDGPGAGLFNMSMRGMRSIRWKGERRNEGGCTHYVDVFRTMDDVNAKLGDSRKKGMGLPEPEGPVFEFDLDSINRDSSRPNLDRYNPAKEASDEAAGHVKEVMLETVPGSKFARFLENADRFLNRCWRE